jgi:hypothetical protein
MGLWAISLLGYFVLIPDQLQINRLNATEHPSHHPIRRFSGANIAAIVVGGLVVLLALVGAFLTPS